jgi:hypothetical protein
MMMSVRVGFRYKSNFIEFCSFFVMSKKLICLFISFSMVKCRGWIVLLKLFRTSVISVFLVSYAIKMSSTKLQVAKYVVIECCATKYRALQ